MTLEFEIEPIVPACTGVVLVHLIIYTDTTIVNHVMTAGDAFRLASALIKQGVRIQEGQEAGE